MTLKLSYAELRNTILDINHNYMILVVECSHGNLGTKRSEHSILTAGPAYVLTPVHYRKHGAQKGSI